MTLRATQRMLLVAESMGDTVQRSLAKRAACENKARAEAQAAIAVQDIIAGSDLPYAAAMGALSAVQTHLTALKGRHGAELAILARMGRRQ